jgi:hypothetical protein
LAVDQYLAAPVIAIDKSRERKLLFEGPIAEVTAALNSPQASGDMLAMNPIKNPEMGSE